jgi:catechol 2,3-dioxygenase-like lactoylglutathione lyase family enzyme
MIHSMIRVLDEARSVEFYSKVFGLEIADRIDFDTFTLIYLSNRETGFELELTINKGPTRAASSLTISATATGIWRCQSMKSPWSISV